jgi:hypothetical protein
VEYYSAIKRNEVLMTCYSINELEHIILSEKGHTHTNTHAHIHIHIHTINTHTHNAHTYTHTLHDSISVKYTGQANS